MSRRAKVEQDGSVSRQKHDVVWRNVAVEDVIFVDGFQCTEHRRQQTLEPRLIWRLAHFLQSVLQCAACAVRHGHVGRPVGLPEAINLYQRRVVELSKQLGLVDEAAPTCFERLRMPLRSDADERGFSPPSQRLGHVLFQRDTSAK